MIRYTPSSLSGRTGPTAAGGKAHGENVVTLDRFRPALSLTPLRQTEAYWLALAEGSQIPRRSQIDPRGLANILAHTFILEQVAPRVARFRLAGSLLEELAGMDVRGMPFTALFADTARAEAGEVLERLFTGPKTAELTLRQTMTNGRPGGEGRMLLLPLATDDGEIARALGVVVADPRAGTQPCRFEIEGRRLRPACPQQPPQATGSKPALNQPPVPEYAQLPDPRADAGTEKPGRRTPMPTAGFDGFSEAQAQFANQPGHLRLVK